jgi:hypothetical protein
MSELVKTKTIAEALGVSVKTVLARAKKERWLCRQTPQGNFWLSTRLPDAVKTALVRAEAGAVTPSVPAPVSPESLFARASGKEKESALLRSECIMRWKKSGMRKEDFLAAYNAGIVDAPLRNRLGAVSKTTFYRWIAYLKHSDGDIGALVPRHSLAKKGAGATLSDTEKRLLMHFWLKDTQPSMMSAYGLMRANVPNSACTYQTARRFLESIAPAVIDLHRNGKAALADNHLPYVDRTIEERKSLDCVVSDHHCLDMVCLYNDKLVRPWVTTFQDYRSGKVLGWCLSLNPSSLSIICAYYMAVIAYGIPRAVLFDNGKDYRSKLLNGLDEKVFTKLLDGIYEEVETRVRGLFEIIGSEVHFTETYNGKSKGRQERYYRMLQEYIAKPSGGYIGSDTKSRPESSELFFRNIQGQLQNNDLPAWEDVKGMVNTMIPFINDHFHSSGKGMNGKTASRVFEENLPPDVRRADREVLAFALTRGKVMKIRKSQVWIRGIGYYNENFIAYPGREVIVRQSLLTDAEVLICDLDDRYLFTAAANEFREAVGNPRQAIEAVKRARKRLIEVAEIGAREARADIAYETWLDVSKSKYSQNQMVAVDDYVGLPKAACGEDFTGADSAQKTKKTVKPVKGLFDAGEDDEF